MDAKGTYAQPLQLLNIEEISVQNLPNVYDHDEDVASSYPDLADTTPPSLSVLDLSRATSLERLVVTQGWDNSPYGVDPGSLSIVGIRNGATASLEGGFTEDLYLHYGRDFGSEVNLELSLGDTDDFDLYVAQNTNTLNLASNGDENWLQSGWFGGNLRTLNITGDAALYIEEDLGASGPSGAENSFAQGRPATIDASANTGGVELTLNNHGERPSDVVEFLGTNAGDSFTSEGSQAVEITGGRGDNIFDTDGSRLVTITSSAGDDEMTSVGSESVTIDAGDGENDILASAEEISITTGADDDSLVLAGTGGATGDGGGATGLNLMLILDDSGSMAGENLDSLKAGVNGMLDQLVADGINTATVSIIFGSGATAPTAWGSIADARAAVDAMTAAGGGTNFDAALVAAMDAFDNPGKIAGAQNVSIFVSDAGGGLTDSTAWLTFLNANDIYSEAIGLNVVDVSTLDEIAFDGVSGVDIPAIATDAQGLADVLDGIIEDVVVSGGDEALVNIDVDGGSNTLQLGKVGVLEQGLVALDGSTITGSDIHLNVDYDSDLSRAELTGITSVTLAGERATGDEEQGELTISAEQFGEIGASAFSVDRASFGETQDLIIVVTDDATLSDLVTLADLSRNVRLSFDIRNGATLTLSAEELHTYVSNGGIDSTDGLNGKVVITDAGLTFDPFVEEGSAVVIPGGPAVPAGTLTDSFVSSR